MENNSIQKLLEQQQGLNQAKPSDRSRTDEVNDIVLTDEEIEQVIYMAKKQKLADKNYKEWHERISKPAEVIKLNTMKLKEFVEWRAKEEGIPFVINSEDFEIYNSLLLYFSENKEFENIQPGFSLKKGLLIYGNVGCGKTTMMRVFRNNPLYSFRLASCRDISKEAIKEGATGIEKYFGKVIISTNILNQKEQTFCFDDMGAEGTAKNYGNEINVMAEIILSRYDIEQHSQFRCHITSNLTAKQIGETYGDRVKSRMSEMFNIISYPENAKDKRKNS